MLHVAITICSLYVSFSKGFVNLLTVGCSKRNVVESVLAEYDGRDGATGESVTADYRPQGLPRHSTVKFGRRMLTIQRCDKYSYPVWASFVFAIASALRELEAGLQQRAGLSSRGRLKLTPYDSKPQRLLRQISHTVQPLPAAGTYCAGFEVAVWRCDALANHLVEWMADYALKEDELRVHHGNMYVRLREAAARIYTSDAYATRGEIGEIVLHAICREFFGTVPIAPRVFWTCNGFVPVTYLIMPPWPRMRAG